MVKCPILNDEIDIALCSVIVDVSDGCAKQSILSETVLRVEGFKEICKNCRFHNQE